MTIQASNRKKLEEFAVKADVTRLNLSVSKSINDDGLVGLMAIMMADDTRKLTHSVFFLKETTCFVHHMTDEKVLLLISSARRQVSRCVVSIKTR